MIYWVDKWNSKGPVDVYKLAVIKKKKMNLPYHLNEYKPKIDSLGNQAKSILDFCVSNREIEKFIGRINKEEKLEKESIRILKKAIFADYESTIYTFNWTKEQELKLWEIINSKCVEEDKVYFTLARIQSSNKSAYELKELYFKSFDQHLDYIFSLDDKTKEQFYKNKETRYEFLKYEFRARITQWEDFEDNWNEEKDYWKKRFVNDEKAMEIIDEELNKKRKTTDNRVGNGEPK
jgi:hypothetical protein